MPHDALIAHLSSSLSTQASFQLVTKSSSISIWTKRKHAEPTRATQPAQTGLMSGALLKQERSAVRNMYVRRDLIARTGREGAP